jgi:hypothetical protein
VFASKSLAAHLARGAIGLVALAAAAFPARVSLWAPVALLPVALVALRGCPMCWTVGLIQTIAARARGERPRGPCDDGGCATASRRRR